jgi:hypothetical protein
MSATAEVPRLPQKNRNTDEVVESSAAVADEPGSWKDNVLGILGVIITLSLLAAGVYVIFHDLI